MNSSNDPRLCEGLPLVGTCSYQETAMGRTCRYCGAPDAATAWRRTLGQQPTDEIESLIARLELMLRERRAS